MPCRPTYTPGLPSFRRAWADELRSRGYHIVGDLAELQPDDHAASFFDPDKPRERLVNHAALDAIRVLLQETARLRQVEEDLHQRLRDCEEALERSYLRPSYRLREKAVAKLEDRFLGKGVLKAYRRARGRSSRSA